MINSDPNQAHIRPNNRQRSGIGSDLSDYIMSVWTLLEIYRVRCNHNIEMWGAESWVVPGWDLITPVGVHVEIVMEGDETTEEGGPTW